jgi:hypothetical protein
LTAAPPIKGLIFGALKDTPVLDKYIALFYEKIENNMDNK